MATSSSPQVTRRYQTIQRVVGFLIMLSSLTMLPPALVGSWYRDGSAVAFLEGFAILVVVGSVIWWPVRKVRQELRIRDGFIIVVAAWLVLGLSGSVPLVLAKEPVLTFTDAVFESVSGLTTTGATTLTGLDLLPKGILYYRHQGQWLGGMGIIVLAIAVLPMLRVGGMQMYRAETPGPMKDNKLTPRIAETAKALWYLYLGLTVLCAVAYWMAGMTLFDAIGHSFSTLSTGGLSTHDLSFAYFDSPSIELIGVVFMFIAGVNFSLHFMAWRKASMTPYLGDPELKAYLFFVILAAGLCVYGLSLSSNFSLSESFRHGLFQAVSVATSTGFGTDSFYLWPGALPLLLMILSCIGACAGSTAGGIKVIRILLMYVQGQREITRLIHPSAAVPIKLGGRRVPEHVVQAVWGFFSLYVVSFCLMSLTLTALDVDIVTAVSAVLSCLNNLGPALGEAGPHYASLPDAAMWVLSLAMIMGRLELFTLLVVLSPMFWRD